MTDDNRSLYHCIKCGAELKDGVRDDPAPCDLCADLFYKDNGFAYGGRSYGASDEEMKVVYDRWLQRGTRKTT